uniref:Uncharacterized protein n=1 Tax=Cucumis melo TaxID=3656 RepID=A0A9I9DVG2_CUCME
MAKVWEWWMAEGDDGDDWIERDDVRRQRGGADGQNWGFFLHL